MCKGAVRHKKSVFYFAFWVGEIVKKVQYITCTFTKVQPENNLLAVAYPLLGLLMGIPVAHTVCFKTSPRTWKSIQN